MSAEILIPVTPLEDRAFLLASSEDNVALEAGRVASKPRQV